MGTTDRIYVMTNEDINKTKLGMGFGEKYIKERRLLAAFLRRRQVTQRTKHKLVYHVKQQ